MTVADFITQVRIVIDDTVAPYLISDDDIVYALNAAQSDFAEQTYCLFSGADLEVEATANSPWVELPERILAVRALVNANGSYIRPVTTVEMDYGHFSVSGLAIRQDAWRALKGVPRFAVTDQSKSKLRLVPMPATSATLTLEAYMLPAPITGIEVPGEEEGDPAIPVVPEIPSEYHQDLIAGVASILYGTQNVEIFDPNKSQEWMMKWQMAISKAQDQLDTARRVVARNFKLPRTMEYRATGTSVALPSEQSPQVRQ